MAINGIAGTGRVGIATARLIGCHARRNRLRRRVREAVRKLGVSAWDGMDIVVTVKPAAKEALVSEIEEELRNLVTELRSRWANGSASD